MCVCVWVCVRACVYFMEMPTSMNSCSHRLWVFFLLYTTRILRFFPATQIPTGYLTADPTALILELREFLCSTIRPSSPRPSCLTATMAETERKAYNCHNAEDMPLLMIPPAIPQAMGLPRTTPLTSSSLCTTRRPPTTRLRRLKWPPG